MLGYGCGVSQYHQFYYKYLDRYQVLPFPYRVYFESFPGYKFVKEKWVLDLEYQTKTFAWGNIEKKILFNFERNTYSSKRKPTVKMQK